MRFAIKDRGSVRLASPLCFFVSAGELGEDGSRLRTEIISTTGMFIAKANALLEDGDPRLSSSVGMREPVNRRLIHISTFN